MIAYQFDEATGSREDLSILHNDVLVVLASASQKAQVDAIVEAHIKLAPDHTFDQDFDKARLVQALAALGFQAEWLWPNVYINEE